MSGWANSQLSHLASLIRNLKDTIVEFNKKSDKLNTMMLCLTIILVILTFVLAVLTAVLIFK